VRGRGKYPPTGNRVSFAGTPTMLKVVAWCGLREYALLPSEFPRTGLSGSPVSEKNSSRKFGEQTAATTRPGTVRYAGG
jgi:hypothetical protein